MSSAAPEVTRTLAEFASSWQWEQVPERVRHEAKRSLLNFFAVSLAGCNDPTIAKAAGVLKRFRASEQATVIGRGEKSDLLNAAALNAMMANVFDFDDTHIPTIIHPTAPVAPALFALAETMPVTGPQFLLAFVLGADIECRIGNAVSPYHYARGWHITSTCGTFGAAAAAGRLLGLSAKQIAYSFGGAANQACGVVETLGTMSKSLSVGNAARNGLLSALLAAEDYDGPAQPLEGVRGFLNVTCDKPDLAGLVGELGSRWELLNNTYKPYPCGVVLNPVIEACLMLKAGGLDHTRVAKVELVGHPLLRQRTDRPGISTGRQSQVSAQHAVAVTLITGRAGLAEFSDAGVADPAVRALGGKLSFTDVESMSVESASLIVTLDDGKTLRQHIVHYSGSQEKPLSDAAIETKLRDLCAYGRSGCDPAPLIDAVWAMDKSADIGKLLRLAAGRA